MKMLRDLVVSLEQQKEIIALENEINDMIDFGESLIKDSPAPNMSLESIINHLRPAPAQRFSINSLALENAEGVVSLLAFALLVVGALIIAITKFINWLFPSSKSSKSTSYSTMSPSEKSTYFTFTVKQNASRDQLWKDVDSKLKSSGATADKNFQHSSKERDEFEEQLKEILRKGNASASADAKKKEDAAKKAERDKIYVTNVNMIVQEWLKSPEGKDSRTVDFLNAAPNDYYNIADQGMWYVRATDLIPAMTNLDNLLVKRESGLDAIDSAVVALTGGSFKEDIHVKAIDSVFSGPIMISVDGHQKTLMDAYEQLSQAAENARTDPGQVHGMHFTSMMNNFSNDKLLSQCGHIAGEIGRANTHMPKMTEGLERVQGHLKKLESAQQTDEHKALVVSIRRALDIIRRDIMGHVKLCHQMMVFVDRVGRMNSDLLHAERTILGVIKKYVKPGEESTVRDFDWAMKRFDEINTLDM